MRFNFNLSIFTISCFSVVGTTGGKQLLSLQRFACTRQGIIQHELLHALGFHHEHTRNDRDQYIKINWENISESKNHTAFLKIARSRCISSSVSRLLISCCHQISCTTSTRRKWITSTLRMTTPPLCTTEGNKKINKKSNRSMLDLILPS